MGASRSWSHGTWSWPASGPGNGSPDTPSTGHAWKIHVIGWIIWQDGFIMELTREWVLMRIGSMMRVKYIMRSGNAVKSSFSLVVKWAPWNQSLHYRLIILLLLSTRAAESDGKSRTPPNFTRWVSIQYMSKGTIQPQLWYFSSKVFHRHWCQI